MKRTVLSVMAAGAALLAASLCDAEFRILTVSGIVRVVQPGGVQITDAQPGLVLAVGSEVKTGENGRVTIEVGPGNTVRLRENGRIMILEPRPRETRMQFLAGRIKGVFKKLTGGEKFSMEFSDSAVASVKGTEFNVESTDTGFRINTLFGAIEFSRGNKVWFIPQGCGASIGEKIRIDLLTEDQIRDGLYGWDEGSSGYHGTGSSGEMKKLADEFRDAANGAGDQVRNLREEDFAAGRTLRDMHGNLTRVHQMIIRPEDNTIAFVNLVKRDDYSYKGKFPNSKIATGARLDYLELKVIFNADLPEALADWPSYFSSHDGVEPTQQVLTLSNGKVREDDGRDTLVWTSTKVPNAGDDEDDWNEVFTVNGQRIFYNDDLDFNHDGDTDDVGDYKSSTYDNVDASGEDSGDLWATNIEPMWLDNGNGVYEPGTGDTLLRFFVEGYVINNDGKIVNLDSLVSSGTQDPIGVLKNTAVEGIVSVNYDAGNVPLLRRGNVDVVMTPDIILSVVEKLASQAASLANNMN